MTKKRRLPPFKVMGAQTPRFLDSGDAFNLHGVFKRKRDAQRLARQFREGRKRGLKGWKYHARVVRVKTKKGVRWVNYIRLPPKLKKELGIK